MISEGCTAKLRRDHTQLHRGLYFLSFATSICFILIHWDERQSRHTAWLSLHWPCAWPIFGKISYLERWLFALWADCGRDAQNASARAASPLSQDFSRAPSTSRPLAPSSGASVGAGSVRGYLTSRSSGHASWRGEPWIRAQELFPHPQRGLFEVSRLQCHL